MGFCSNGKWLQTCFRKIWLPAMLVHNKAILADTITVQNCLFDQYTHCFFVSTVISVFIAGHTDQMLCWDMHRLTLTTMFRIYCYLFIYWFVKPKFSHTHARQTYSHKITWLHFIMTISGRRCLIDSWSFYQYRDGKTTPEIHLHISEALLSLLPWTWFTKAVNAQHRLHVTT